MTNQAKMIIITSDEDIIQRMSLNKAPNTRIIDLDDNMPEISAETINQKAFHLGLLAELSKINSTNDEVYKRPLDSPQHTSAKPAKTPRKSTGLICVICGDRAIGYNYGVSSCGSCKAFFSRNGSQNIDKFQCFTGEGQCSVAHETLPKCSRCRLERCLAAGMRKDLMLSDEMKQRRKMDLERNRSLTLQRLTTSNSNNASSVSNLLPNSESLSATSDEIDRLLIDMTEDDGNILFEENADLNQMHNLLLERLSVEDWITVESMRLSFLATFQSDGTPRSLPDVLDRTSALISWSYIINKVGVDFITFCRQIPEFESFNAEDRLILIKYNLFPLFTVFKCSFYTSQNARAAQTRGLLALCFGSDGVLETFKTLTLSLVALTEQDPVIISLLSTILMFSQGLSFNEDEPALKDPLAVNQAQSHYTRVLWNYMNNKWGELPTCTRFSQLLTIIFRIQLMVKKFRDYILAQFTTTDAGKKLAPLMQSVLNIS